MVAEIVENKLYGEVKFTFAAALLLLLTIASSITLTLCV